MEWRERGLWADRRTELRRPAGCAVASAAALGIIRGTASHDSAPRPPARRNSAPFPSDEGRRAPANGLPLCGGRRRRSGPQDRRQRPASPPSSLAHAPTRRGPALLPACRAAPSACPPSLRPRPFRARISSPAVAARMRRGLGAPLPDGGGMPPALPSRPTCPCPSASAPCGRPCRSSSPARTAKTPRPFFLCIRGRPDRRLRPGCRT